MTALLIDNYDSFTWNLYQYLSELGAKVEVYRNDQITLKEIESLNPARIVISPGPGHPKDSAISLSVIKEYAGKIPILGVCLGEQAIFEVFGGQVTHAGEILHGKTSSVKHDGCGVFSGVSQGVKVTRYHSLAGNPSTLPSCLKVSAVTDSGVIMGIRHVDFTVEGVQFHPESIVSEEGMIMLKNFLSFQGGTWSQNQDLFLEKPLSKAENNAKESILTKIVSDRKADVKLSSNTPGKSITDLKKYIDMGLCPLALGTELILEKIKNSPKTAVFAEIKRASPSRGIISVSINAAEQGLLYADAGASVISVLTEPRHFSGSSLDLRVTRLAVESLGAKRPAILRKDFIFDEYQVFESRVFGADMILLIVAIIPSLERLKELIALSRSLNMEPLVEVNNESEMRTALDADAKIIGVNNRNLHTFEVSKSRTSDLAFMVKEKDVILVALSGIQSREDVAYYENAGVKAVLVGESLMRSQNPAEFIKILQG